ncbi:MAG: hypothetical protein OXI49_17755 [Acidobacteriota bacterium]|nr:hypothetical protein [Acidobacteriota bacterium]
MTLVAIAIGIHALAVVVTIAIMEYFRQTHIDFGEYDDVQGLSFVKQPGYWKYRLVKQHDHEWASKPRAAGALLKQESINLGCAASVTRTGVTLKPGYAWDGSSGPAKDTWTGMRASALHDIWCQAMANRIYVRGFHNWSLGAREYRRVCIADHMPKWRAWGRYVAVWCYGRLKYRHLRR